MPFFSVIIPTYNRAKFINDAMTSVCQQTFEDWECVVVDDGSKDNTREVVDAWCKKDYRFKYIYQENAERSAARNNGAKNSSGKYLIFLDSDDAFEPTHLESLHTAIQNYHCPVAMFFCGAKFMENGVTKVLEFNPPSQLPLDYFIRNAVIPARVCLHRDIFLHLSFDEDCIVVEDTVLWTEILDKFPVHAVRISTVIYKWHGDNSVNLLKYNAFLLRSKGLKKLFFQKPVGLKISRHVKREQLSRCYTGMAEHHRLNKRIFSEFYYIVLSLICYPEVQTKEKIYLLAKVFIGK